MKIHSRVLLIAFLYFVFYNSSTTSNDTTPVYRIKSTLTNVKPTIKQTVVSIGLKKFLDKLAYLESKGKSWVVSSTGYLGKYQFHIKTVKGLGFDVEPEEFLNRESLQDSVVIAYLKHNKRVLNKYIKEYEGQVVDSVYVTKAGILAAAHLVGSGGVITFLTQDQQFSTVDGNGVSAKKYLQLFSKYRLKEI